MIAFAVRVDSRVDLITNSSSELFVVKGDSVEDVKSMVSNVLDPSYASYYKDPVRLVDLEPDDFINFLWYMCFPGCSPTSSKKAYPVPEGFEFDELYKERGVAWNNVMQYELREFTDEQAREMARKMDPDGRIYMIYSHEDNPPWESQEALERIGRRYHLG